MKTGFPRSGSARHSNGMSMLELLIVMAIAAILVAIATPSFNDYQRKNSVFADRKLLNSTLMSARYEAVARNKTVSICPSENGESCSADWSTGWIVFQDDGEGGGTARDGEQNGDEAIVLASIYEGSNRFSVTDTSENSDLTFLSFNEFGRPAVAGRQLNRPILIQICDSSNDDFYARGLMLIGTGRLIQTIDSNGDGIHESRFADAANTVSTTTNLSCSNVLAT